MPIPSNKLLFWFAVIAVPCAALAGVLPNFAIPCVIIVASLALLLLLDAIRGLRLAGRLDIRLPEIVRLSKCRPGHIEIKVRHDFGRGGRIRVGLPLPDEVRSPHDALEIMLPPTDGWACLHWPCEAVSRGVFPLNQLFYESPSPMGFWSIRSPQAVRCELRVYPNLLSEKKNLSALFLRRATIGQHAQRQVGKGRDFEKLREYIPGDSYDEIHWKATAKRSHPVTKVFQIERTQEMYVLVDASRLSGRRIATGDTWLERYITSALVLGLTAEQQGDLFGLVTFAERVEKFIRASQGKGHYDTCRDALFTLQPHSTTPDFEEVATFVRTRIRRRSLLLFLTALDDPLIAENFVRSIDVLCRQHLVLVAMLRPPGALPLFTQLDTTSIDQVYGHLGGHQQWHKLRQLEKVLRRRNVQLSLVDNEKLTGELITQYLTVKQRQIL